MCRIGSSCKRRVNIMSSAWDYWAKHTINAALQHVVKCLSPPPHDATTLSGPGPPQSRGGTIPPYE